MDKARYVRREVTTNAAQPGSKLGGATFVVFCLCLIALMVMGTIKIGMLLFS
jgi:hypothetical protein